MDHLIYLALGFAIGMHLSNLLKRKERPTHSEETPENANQKSSWVWVAVGGLFLSGIAALLFSFFLFVYEMENPGNVISRLGPFPWKKEERRFSVKVLPFYGGSEYYQIAYSDNGFLTSDNLKEYIDWNNEVQLWLGSKEEAVQIAKTIKSYDQCLLFNKHVDEQVKKATGTIEFKNP